jgi:putative FmdB family regulatory protein
MPIYEYRCQKGHSFDVIQRMTDDPVTECKVCGAPVARVLHAPAVHFKGSGFYNTDYGTRKRAREKEASSNGAGKESASSKSSSDGDSGGSSGGDSSSSSGGDSSGSSDKKSSTSSEKPAAKTTS